MNRYLHAAVAVTLFTALSSGAAPAQTGPRVRVEVEDTKPEKEELSTLRFLKENRDFLRARLDGFQETPTKGQEIRALDERLLEYQELLLASRAARDSIDRERARREKETLLASVTEFRELEAHLDFLEDVLTQQEKRLGVLEEDLLGDQRTAMIVVIKGSPPGHQLRGLQILDGFEQATEVALRPEQLTSLEEGGLIQVYHALIEPREQTWQIVLEGPGWSAEPAYLTFSPRRNRLNFMMVDLAAADPGSPATGLSVAAWFHDPSRLLGGGLQ